MSFRFKNTTVTLSNYQQIFKECSPDILDEIRSAVLDDTSISKFIKPCGTDSYKLGQIRMALRELIPIEYLSTDCTGRTIYVLRNGFSSGKDMSSLLVYIKRGHLVIDADIFEILTEHVFIGADISKVDFKEIPSNLVKIICKGLLKGYPMWLLFDGKSEHVLSEYAINLLMKGMQLGIDVHRFLNGLWDERVLVLLFSHSKSADINSLLSNINHLFSEEEVRVLLDLVEQGVPIDTLCVKDTQGYPVYNQFQMYELGEAIADGSIVNEMYNASLSDMDIAMMHGKILRERNKKLSASLNKSSINS